MIRKIFTSQFLGRALPALMIATALLISTRNIALAHGRVEAGKYLIIIGFHNEPAYQGDVNGIEFGVRLKDSEEPVKGLEDTLKVEVIYGESKRELPVRAQWGREGWYVGYLQPTMAGDYTVHIWGQIEDTPVDVTMTSSPDTFSSVQTKADIAFPAADPTVAELQTRSDESVQAAQAAAQSAQLALMVGIAGAVLGAAGLVVGLMGLRAKKA